MKELTRILDRARGGDPSAAEELFVALYDELRSMARREMASERCSHTLQPTALVHEAWMRLVQGAPTFEDRVHFFGAAASAIRRVLVEHARQRNRLKRGGAMERVDLDPSLAALPMRDESWVALDEVLRDLAQSSPTLARIVELRFFGGMTVPEVALLLGVSESTVERDWRLARAWLRGELGERDGS